MSAWTVEVFGNSFPNFLASLSPYEQSVVIAAVRNVLSVEGIAICSGEWGKPLGGGLYEFRIRKSLHAIEARLPADERIEDSRQSQHPVLIRIFCSFHGDRIVVLHHGYNKQRDPSEKRQQREIRHARKILREWKEGLK